MPDVPLAVCGATCISPTKPHLPASALAFAHGLPNSAASDLEDLDAVVAAIAGVEESIAAHGRAVHRAAEEQGLHVAGLVIGDPRADVGVGHARARIVDDGILPVGTEVTDVLSRRGIHDQDASIAIAIGDVEAVRLRVDAHVRH